MSSLIHQFIFQVIREEKRQHPEAFIHLGTDASKQQPPTPAVVQRLLSVALPPHVELPTHIRINRIDGITGELIYDEMVFNEHFVLPVYGTGVQTFQIYEVTEVGSSLLSEQIIDFNNGEDLE